LVGEVYVENFVDAPGSKLTYLHLHSYKFQRSVLSALAMSSRG
jgi:hypothetical protein